MKLTIHLSGKRFLTINNKTIEITKDLAKFLHTNLKQLETKFEK